MALIAAFVSCGAADAAELCGALREERSDDSDARRGEAAYGDLFAEERDRGAADADDSDALRHFRIRQGREQHALTGYADMVPEGYIFVFQDIRGRYGSEGKFVMLRPIHDAKDAKEVDESTDTYDTIDWLIRNVSHNNGRVGLNGTSYDGFLVAMGMINPHPALKPLRAGMHGRYVAG